jgi:flagellar assembly protein FliH
MSSVIKRHCHHAGQAAVAFNLDDVTAHAERYLESVRAQGEAILAEARSQAVAILKAAEAQGRQAAIEEGRKAAQHHVAEQLQTLMPALRKSISELVQARQDWLAHWEQRAVHVAAAIASRVIRRELSRHPQITAGLIREALELAAGNPHVRVLLNPDDHRALADQAARWAAELAPAATAEITADPAISPGGCRIETRFGAIDQQIETQLRRIEEELA